MSSLLKLLNVKNFFVEKKGAPSTPHIPIEDIIDVNPTTVTKEELPGVPGGFLLNDVLTETECHHFVQVAETLGFEEAMNNNGGYGDQEYPSMPDMRPPEMNKRSAAKASHPILHHLWKRVKDSFPPQLEHEGKIWKLREDETALNEMFRFLRYDANQKFWAHFDGGFRRGPNEQTHFTFIMYLNDEFDGGETIIFPEGKTGIHGKPPKQEVRVKPKRGMALVFRHTGPDHPLHSGAPHFSNGMRKYILRTDVMYILKEEEERNV